MFQACVLEEAKLRGTGILVCLNQLSLLPEADEVVFLQDGRIQAHGPFDTCVKTSPEFASFVESFVEDPTSEEDAPLSPIKEETQVSADSKLPPTESILKIEARSQGAVSSGVYLDYLRAFGRGFALVCLLCLVAGCKWELYL
jgi:ABC-type multidrug transport system ATPase subunit